VIYTLAKLSLIAFLMVRRAFFAFLDVSYQQTTGLGLGTNWDHGRIHHHTSANSHVT
jgi:hypothetical protein